jgi:hypothetical protein
MSMVLGPTVKKGSIVKPKQEKIEKPAKAAKKEAVVEEVPVAEAAAE